ncbi:rhodanese-like domain-containing protein [Maritimibacter dapengensis]|uniref:Rhodanese-like domain-containing protein n=1 Tax=Maritimibacter dapengensis TaxID=2836868 RepID=A0ABS6SYI5_9RHOB|nr:rhodanese-like domain-containing protein [Maritimibacter dapengensis]MBV7377990.1 rhodanese-like domain-containing protein [Maritimibacter dapengensis]
MERRHFLVLAGIGGVALIAGGGYFASMEPAGAGYEHRPLTAADLTEGDALVVDIRRPEEWAETGVVEGSMLFTFTTADRFLAQVSGELSDGRDLVLICRTGNRTQAAADALAGQIPNRIVSVEGGITRIISDGYQTVKPR